MDPQFTSPTFNIDFSSTSFKPSPNGKSPLYSQSLTPDIGTIVVPSTANYDLSNPVLIPYLPSGILIWVQNQQASDFKVVGPLGTDPGIVLPAGTTALFSVDANNKIIQVSGSGSGGGAAGFVGELVKGLVDVNVPNLAAFAVAGAGRDGLTYVQGDIVLLGAQTVAAQNGPYLVGAVVAGNAPLKRPSWWEVGTIIPSNFVFYLSASGTLYGGFWLTTLCAYGTQIVDTNDPILKFIGTIKVANLTTALSTNWNNSLFLDGQQIWVASRRRFFQYNLSSTAALVSGEVVATRTTVGRYVSLDPTTDFTWSQVASWKLDPTNGDDDNDGTVLAIKTGEELERRWGKGLLRSVNCTVTVQGPGANLLVRGILGSIVFIGSGATTVFSGTMTAQTAIVRTPAPGNPQLIQASGLANSWTALGGIDKRIRTTSGTLGTAWAMIDDGTVNKQVETTPFVNSSLVQYTPAGNETFVVESLQTAAILTTNVPQSFGDLFVEVIDLEFTGNVNIRAGFALFAGCKFSSFLNGLATAFIECIGCLNVGTLVTPGDASTMWCLQHGFGSPMVVAFGQAAQGRAAGDSFFRDATLFTNNRFARIGPCFFKNTTASKVLVDTSSASSVQSEGGEVFTEGIVYGSTTGAATAGFLLGKGARVDLGGFVAAFTSTGSNYQFGSTGRSIAQLPFVDQFNVGAGPVANSNMAQAL